MMCSFYIRILLKGVLRTYAPYSRECCVHAHLTQGGVTYMLTVLNGVSRTYGPYSRECHVHAHLTQWSVTYMRTFSRECHVHAHRTLGSVSYIWIILRRVSSTYGPYSRVSSILNFLVFYCYQHKHDKDFQK